MTDGVMIRSATKRDYQAIVSLHQQQKWSIDTLQKLEEFLQGGHTIFVAEEDGQIMGKVDVVEKIQNSEKVLSLQRLIVHPNHRRKGIASALIAAAEKECKNRNIRSMDVAVQENDSLAKSLYEKQGFKERARRIYLQKKL